MSAQKIMLFFYYMLFLLSGIVVKRMLQRKSTWEFIVTYWAVLMIKNLIDLLGVW